MINSLSSGDRRSRAASYRSSVFVADRLVEGRPVIALDVAGEGLGWPAPLGLAGDVTDPVQQNGPDETLKGTLVPG